MWKKNAKLSLATALMIGLAATLLFTTPVPVGGQTDEPDNDEMNDEPMLLSAFFGLDNEIIRLPLTVCRGSQGQDGMPVIFSHPVDVETLDPEDFKVTSAEGMISTPICALLQPAVDDGENRTALLIGEFGTALDDEPVVVEVVGELLSSPETGAVDFNGTSVDVIPLAEGPEIITAQVLPEDLWILDREGQRAVGSGCPSEGTLQVLRVRWTGGITKPNDEEVDDLEREQYMVTIEAADGSTEEVIPFALGNLGDNDNIHDLCLDVEGEPVSVSFPAGLVTDPNSDLNPETGAEVTSFR
jgi:hypothetical protein